MRASWIFYYFFGMSSYDPANRALKASRQKCCVLTYESGELTEPPGDVDGQHGAVALLQGQVGQVVGEAAQLLGDAGVAQVQHDVQAQGFEGREVTLPGGVVKLDAGRVLLVLGQAQHLQVVVAHKVISLRLWAAQCKILEVHINLNNVHIHNIHPPLHSTTGLLLIG